MQPLTTQPTPAATTHPPVLLPLIAALVAFALPWLGPLAYPFRLLTTIVHELGHGLAAMLSGGAFLRFVVFPNGAGLAYTAGGNPWLIIPAGYLGAALKNRLSCGFAAHCRDEKVRYTPPKRPCWRSRSIFPLVPRA